MSKELVAMNVKKKSPLQKMGRVIIPFVAVLALSFGVAETQEVEASTYSAVTHSVVKQGSRGPAVVELQNQLKRHGYGITADGIFGASTHRAVVAFQKGHKLGVDGIVGKATWNRLIGNSGTTVKPSSPAVVNKPVLKQGSRGTAVVELQNQLRRHGYGLTADGIFGAGTRNVVLQFQKGHKLGADGIVGQATWNRLIGNSGSTSTVKPPTTSVKPPTTAPSTPTINKPVLKQGSRGPAVVELQNQLRRHGYGLTADGIFGAGTRNVVLQFQKGHKLGADGIVGQATWNRLIGNSGSTSTVKPPTNTSGKQVINGVTYVNGILIANKEITLPSTYAPGESPQARSAFNQMQRDVRNAYGWNITAFSTYRSYSYQKGLFDRYVKQHGLAEASRWSARAGHSEHQTGLAFDVGEVGKEKIWTTHGMGDTQFGKWLANNAHKYGFIIRYPKGKESITGYDYEPWHLRYLGVDTATKVKNSGKTLEEYLGLK